MSQSDHEPPGTPDFQPPIPPGTPGTVTAQQLYAALVALGCAPVPHPEHRPNGAIEEDIPNLLGVLLGRTEQAILMQAGHNTDDLFIAYHESVPSDAWLALLWNRLARTETELNNVVGNELVDAGEHALRAAVRLVQLAMYGELSRSGPAAEDHKIGRAFKQARNALVSARRALDNVRSHLAASGFRV